MIKKQIISLFILGALVCFLVPTTAVGQDIQRTRIVEEQVVTTGSIHSRMATLGCIPGYTELKILPADTDEAVLQTFSIMALLETCCEAFTLLNGRMPEDLAELRNSGLWPFEPVAQEYSPGLKLIGDDVAIKIRELLPQEHDGGAEIVHAMDWYNTEIPGLIAFTGDSEVTNDSANILSEGAAEGGIYTVTREPVSLTVRLASSDLSDDITDWAALYVDIASNGIFLAGYEVEAVGMVNPLTRLGFNPQPEPPGYVAEESSGIEPPGSYVAFNPQPEPPGYVAEESSTFEFPGSWVFFNPQPEPPGSIGPDPWDIIFRRINYHLWKGDPYAFVNTESGEDEEDPMLKITPWVLASSRLIDPGDDGISSRLIDPGDDGISSRLIDPGDDGITLRMQSPVSSSPRLIDPGDDETPFDRMLKCNLIMEVSGIIMEDYVARHGTVPLTATELLDGKWEINSNGFINTGTIGAGLPGSCKMIIIVNTKPAEFEPAFFAFFEMVTDTGELKIFERRFDPVEGGSWDLLDPSDGAIVIINGAGDTILDTSDGSIIIENYVGRSGDDGGTLSIIEDNRPSGFSGDATFHLDNYGHIIGDSGLEVKLLISSNDPIIDSSLPGWGFTQLRLDRTLRRF